jgi:hypothetical protein
MSLASQRIEQRNKHFLMPFSPPFHSNTVELRKAKRQDCLSKRRFRTQELANSLHNMNILLSEDLKSKFPYLNDESFPTDSKISRISEDFAAGNSSPDLLRLMISITNTTGNAPAQFTQMAVANKLVQIIDNPSVINAKNALELCINLSFYSREFCGHLVGLKVIQIVAKRIEANFKDEANCDGLWLIDNLIIDDIRLVGEFEKLDLFNFLAEELEKTLTLSKDLIFCSVKLMETVLKHRKLVKDPYHEAFLRIADRLLLLEHNEILIYAVLALGNIMKFTENIEKVIRLNLNRRIFSFLDRNNDLSFSALRYFGMICLGSSKEVNTLITLGLLDKLMQFLLSEKLIMRKESLWILSNCILGQENVANQILARNDFVFILQNTQENVVDLKIEALTVLSLLAEYGNFRNVFERSVEILRYLVLCLKIKDARILCLAMKSLGLILKCGSKMMTAGQRGLNVLLETLNSLDGIDLIEVLQQHPNTEVFEAAQLIILEYFNCEIVETPAICQEFS